MNDLVIIGASGHGKVVADIACKIGYKKIVFLDDNVNVRMCGEYNVVGCCNDAKTFRDSHFFVAIGNPEIREKIQLELEDEGLNIVSLVHPAAVVASSVEIGVGSVVMAGAVINPCARIGNGCIINTCSSVDHDSVVGDFSHISVGTHIAGTVKIGSKVWIGAGVTVSNNVEIISDSVIGAGAVVVKNISAAGTYVGVPAKRIK